MKIKIISILFLICSYSQELNGQANNTYIEFLGVGLLKSVNYEKMVVPDKVFARVSLGDLSDIETDGTAPKLKITPICLGVNYMVGNKWRLELGGGIAYWIISYEGEIQFNNFDNTEFVVITGDGNYFNLYSTLGLRYQNPEGGINFKFGLSPTYAKIEGVQITFNLPHLSIGYSW